MTPPGARAHGPGAAAPPAVTGGRAAGAACAADDAGGAPAAPRPADDAAARAPGTGRADGAASAPARPAAWVAHPGLRARPLDPRGRAFDLGRTPSLGAMLDEATLRGRGRTFLVLRDREREVERVAFEAYRREVGRAARALAARGVGPGDRVAILMANGPRWLALAGATLALGAVLVPLDARAEPQEQGRLLAHAGARLLACDAVVWRRLRDVPRGAVEHVLVDRGPGGPAGDPAPGEDLARALDAAGPGDWPRPAGARAPGPEDPATIVYSSGTAGGAKGCVLPHRAYLAQAGALATLYPLAHGDAYLSVLPASHALDFMCGFLVPALCGARVVHLATLRPEWLVDACRRERVTHLAAVPALLAALERRVRERLDAEQGLAGKGLRGLLALRGALERDRPRDGLARALLGPVLAPLGGRLRRIFAGGAFVPRATARFLTDVGLPVAIGYGLTEACAVVTVNDLQPFRDDTVGLPLAGTDVRIDAPGPDGAGEVCVRGPQVFRGYLDDPERTADALGPDGWLRTGDVGRLDPTGHLVLVGRKKHMVVTAGGKNVYPEDVEGAFDGLCLEEHAVVAAHAVWPSRPGDDEALVLVARPGPGAGGGALAPEALAGLARRNAALPEHKRVAGVVVAAAPFPRTTSLKLRREALCAALAGQAGGRGAVRPLGASGGR